MFSVSGGEYIIIFKWLFRASRVSFAFRNPFREICYYMRADRTGHTQESISRVTSNYVFMRSGFLGTDRDMAADYKRIIAWLNGTWNAQNKLHKIIPS